MGKFLKKFVVIALALVFTLLPISGAVYAEGTSSNTPIMGSSVLTEDQMIKYLSDNNKTKSSSDVKSFTETVMKEANDEGVRPDVAFVLMMKETNFLKFDGTVKANQNNFGGLGCTDDGVVGDSYPDVTTGIRAVVQHLKGYASTDNLKNPVVDKRFEYLKDYRGRILYVEDLGITENPEHIGWATDPGYGTDIVNRINSVKGSNTVVQNAKATGFSIPSGMYAGKGYTLTGNGTSGNKVLYKFWEYNKQTGKWRVIQDYSENNTCTWTPATSGKYGLVMHVKDVTSGTNDCDDYKAADVTVNGVNAKATGFSIPSGMYAGKGYTLNGSGTSGNKVLYKFWEYNKQTDKWRVIQDYSENNTCTWTPATSGKYGLVMHVKDATSGTNDCDDYKAADVTVNGVNAKATGFSIPSGMYAGKGYTLTGSGTSGNKVLYKFWEYNKQTGKWRVIQDYSENNTCTWTPATSGKYGLVMHVKDATSGTNDCDDYKAADVTVVDNTVKEIDITDKPQYLSSNIYENDKVNIVSKFHIDSNNLYQFWVCDVDNNKWQLIKDYGTDVVASWIPDKPRHYGIVLHVKNKDSRTTDCDFYSYVDINVKSKGLGGKTIVLDAGHGGTDPGATTKICGGYEESALNLNLTKLIGQRLKDLGANVIYTRTDDTYYSLDQRTNLSKSDNADLFLSVHHNSSTSSSANGAGAHYSSFRPDIDYTGSYVIYKGVKCYVNSEHGTLNDTKLNINYNGTKMDIELGDAIAYNEKPSYSAQESQKLANMLEDAMVSSGFKNDGIEDHNLYVTRHTDCPSVLIEAGFISNQSDLIKSTDVNFQNNLSNNIANVIEKFFEQ